ncbi:DUF3347 domain-containing protein [Roseivirga misakiensis]|uniref:DUF3347 domain-containing protein n=1 Tax=Roseivirga misakiensis TaxID=1563681 RepID=A0A1E5T2U6_9BACT|nr:DUF3347 domain-containing protein [Roseivirga misakiensis]OEK05708.1 hypothetical protein BFP71_06185 [Roseivirga misakiensis]
MIKRNIILLAIFVLIAGCGQKKQQSSAPNEEDGLSQYLAIKDALVKTNAKETQRLAKTFLATNTNPKLNSVLEEIAATTNVDKQRLAFEKLSEEMYTIVKSDGATTLLYKQYCPMAFNNKGAFWLATEKEINNPYFGNLMLHCGSVQETISQ